MIARLLRWTAIAIAVAASVDPSVTISGRQRPRLAVAIENSFARDLAPAVAARLTRDLAQEFEFVDPSDESAAVIVIIGDRYPPALASVSQRLSTVSLPRSSQLSPNVRILHVGAPRAVPRATAVRIEATVEAVGLRGATTNVIVETGGFE